MQLNDKTGISCDLCGGQHRHDFTYYSADFRRILVNNNTRPRSNRAAPSLSLDLCPSCWGLLGVRVVTNYRAVYRGLVCDLTGLLMQGTYEYYDCEISEIVVKLAGGKASIATNPSLAELTVSPAGYNELHNRFVEVRKVAGTWSSSAGSPPANPPKPSTTRIP